MNYDNTNGSLPIEYSDCISKASLTEYCNKAWDAIETLQTEGLNFLGHALSMDHIGIRVPWGPLGEGDYSLYIEVRDNLIKNGSILICEQVIPPIQLGDQLRFSTLQSLLQAQMVKLQTALKYLLLD